jgi:hypothetical protein
MQQSFLYALLDASFFSNAGCNLLVQKTKPPEEETLRRITQIENNWCVLAMRHYLFCKEKTINGHQLYSTKNLGKLLKIYSMKSRGKSQIAERIVFLNETLFSIILFQNETLPQ